MDRLFLQLDALGAQLSKDLEFIGNPGFKGHCIICSKPAYAPSPSYACDGINYVLHETTCLRCTSCETPLATAELLLLDDETRPLGKNPTCRACYEDKIAGRCKACGKVTDGPKLELADGSIYHPQCFACIKCSKQISGRHFVKEDGFVCLACYEELYLPTCKRCSQKIKPDEDGQIRPITLKESTYHQSCFVCTKCEKPLELKVSLVEDKPYCTTCVESLTRRT